MAEATHVKGTRAEHDVMLYALSTCIWCKKTKKLLDALGVEYRYYFVDQLTGAEEDEVMAQVKRHNPECTFPTLVIDGKRCIVGFKDPELRKALG